MAENYDLIFGQSASSQYAWSDSDYQNGWQTVGSTPPTAEQFDALQRRSDTKAKELNDRLTPIEANNINIFRQPSTAYSVGDVVYVKGAGAKYRLSCVTAGTTSTDELAIPSGAKAGDSITDGTAIWKVEEIESMITAIESDGGLVTLTRVNGSTEQLQIVANNAGAHNAVYRGKDLTAYFDSGEMSKAIAAGTFDDIFVGDYIDKAMTVNGTSIGTVRWRVGELDYFYRSASAQSHHVLMVPDDVLDVNIRMNATDTTEGGYLGSEMWKTTLPIYTAAIQAAFDAAHVLTHQEILTKGISAAAPSAAGVGWTGSTNNWEWTNVTANLMTEPMVYGGTVFSSSGHDVGNAKKQIALFRLDHSATIAGYRGNRADYKWYWLRAVVSFALFAFADANGCADYVGASFRDAYSGVRPYFLLL